MIKTQDIRIEDYNYPLPDERIAKFPLSHRDQSKLLIYKGGKIEESKFFTLPDRIPAGSMMVFNNTKVIQARLHFNKSTGARIEVFCLEPIAPNDYNLSFQSNHGCTWLCMIGNLKKWKEGKLQKEIVVKGDTLVLEAERIATTGNTHQVHFSWEDEKINFADILEAIGELPIPPYLNRDTEESDKETYQTVYSKIKGSVAAPTAGLHFTPEVFENLKKHDVRCEELTLHVGAGTFQPVKSELISDHTMHTEFISVNKSLIEAIIANKGKLIAVGTTSVRTLESLYYIGVTIAENPDATSEELRVTQWQPYARTYTMPAKEALQHIVDYLDRHQTDKLLTATQIMIAPGYTFRIVEGIVTNFHQPQSTLLLLISAFIKGNWQEIYQYALDHEFRFLSYGDSSLLLPE
ncbi:MAG: S-adenosylmethionine:tRNA ribosyltransferase-isomerase [Bacteroidales bacterium]